MDPYVGEIRLFAGSYAPVGWAFCDGSLLAIQTYAALFSVIGTTYGGNGTTNFALPDLRGRAPIHQGEGPGLTARVLAQSGGTDSVTLTLSEIPNHTHPLNSEVNNPTGNNPQGQIWSSTGRRGPLAYSQKVDSPLSPMAIASAGGSQPHNNRQPYLGVNYIMALEGVYPSRPS